MTMTTQQIKDNAPDGANYIDLYGDWWKVSGDVAFFMFKDGEKWTRYAFNDIQHHISKGDLKPL